MCVHVCEFRLKKNGLSWAQCDVNILILITHQLGCSIAQTCHAECCSGNSSACSTLPLGHEYVHRPHPPHFRDGRGGLQSYHDMSTDGDRWSISLIIADCVRHQCINVSITNLKLNNTNWLPYRCSLERLRQWICDFDHRLAVICLYETPAIDM